MDSEIDEVDKEVVNKCIPHLANQDSFALIDMQNSLFRTESYFELDTDNVSEVQEWRAMETSPSQKR